MELTETIESLNKQLIDGFGVDTITNRPIFRIVWSDDQLEKRRVNEINGIQLLHSEVIEIPKYPFIKSLYVLERLVIVPEFNRHELADVILSYEPIWSFCSSKGEYLPPTWPAAKFVVDTLYAALGKKSLAKYTDDTIEKKEERVQKIEEELFGNESDVTDALAYKSGVIVP